MKKLSLSFIIALLVSSNTFAQDANLSGKIRFYGQITAPSCEIMANQKQSSKINFSNCKIKNSEDQRNIQKADVIIQKKETSTNKVTQLVVNYK